MNEPKQTLTPSDLRVIMMALRTAPLGYDIVAPVIMKMAAKPMPPVQDQPLRQDRSIPKSPIDESATKRIDKEAPTGDLTDE